jgi:putative acetyltransferase
MNIREALDSDLENVLFVERVAFDSDEEADLVKDLIGDPSAKPLVSLLAFQDGLPVGHILFTKARLQPKAPLLVSILAPLAIIPEFQNRGIGRKLIENGLQILSESGFHLVFVLGYPEYYRRFGFESAGERGFDAPYYLLDKNADAWMVKALHPGVFKRASGKVICADILNRPEYWHE